MAKDYSKSFYDSAKWKHTQAAYMASCNYICERCGQLARIVHHKTYITPENIKDPFITLNWDNLEALCIDCHNAEHGGKSCTIPGLKFNTKGELVKIEPAQKYSPGNKAQRM